MTRWEDTSNWTDGRLRRSVFFFPSASDLLYGSLYDAAARTGAPPVVLSPSWGRELEVTIQLAHDLAAAIALAGGTALVYHPPGLGDSHGSPEELTLDRLADAAVDAAGILRERAGGAAPCLAGIRLGAQVVLRAWRRVDPAGVLFVQPLLDPALAAGALRERTNGPDPGATAFKEADSLEGFQGPAASVHHPAPDPGPLPDTLRTIVIGGDWRRHERRGEALVPAAAGWVLSGVRGAA